MPTGTLTPTPDSYPPASPAPVRRKELPWTSDASGAVDQQTPEINGSILRVEYVPSASAAPTDQYDVTLLSRSGIDVLGGTGANLSATVASSTVPTVGSTGLPFVVAEPLDLVVANAGNAKQGKLVVYYRP